MPVALSKSLSLIPIAIKDYPMLYELMERIYPPAYNYLWPDNSAWYLKTIYGKDGVVRDLKDQNGFFYFIEAKGEIEGILKIQEDTPYPDQPFRKATRLHRIYLSEKTQGTGIGKQLLQYVEKLALKNGSELLWLDCMDSKLQALRFYEKHGFQKGRLTFLDYKLIKKGYNGMYLMWKPVV
jgi:ribosomal protein S18 acetylase RimI-like enzyme